MGEESDASETVDASLEDATETLEAVEDYLGDVDSLEELDDGTIESVLGDLDALAKVLTEAVELIETADLGELPEAVDGEDLVEAIEFGEVPDVLTDEDAGVTDLVAFDELVHAIDLLSAWNASDLGSLWEAKRELDDATDALGDDEDGLIGEEGLIDDEAIIGDDGDGLVGGDDEMFEDADLTGALGDIDVMEDPEAYQVAIQQGAIEGIDAFRAALLETHAKFERLYEFNREKMRRRDTSANSRNPTASSTMPTERAAIGSGVKHSTVPQSVKLSTAPSRKRIYGGRFERERQKRRNEND
ncbi:hypothetical protein [Natrarchaeobius chitinivorans]|uniref:Uncharacterized protein n=1 Tax=Natrarchaeobius chitinivorans TaxID=1679083 RepID=A0A3N6LYK1_NATCH|nr:hypothetical protein [Natrarchaeobius chitinivorans]RQG95923.1 hypothetical protein EA473_07005 [Natrarchaeobius chitinivorans]